MFHGSGMKSNHWGRVVSTCDKDAGWTSLGVSKWSCHHRTASVTVMLHRTTRAVGIWRTRGRDEYKGEAAKKDPDRRVQDKAGYPGELLTCVVCFLGLTSFPPHQGRPSDGAHRHCAVCEAQSISFSEVSTQSPQLDIQKARSRSSDPSM